MEMENIITPYRVSLRFKELGYTGKCIGYYQSENNFFMCKIGTTTNKEQILHSTDCAALSWTQAIDELYSRFGLWVAVDQHERGGNYGKWRYAVKRGADLVAGTGYWKTWQEATTYGILKAIDIAKVATEAKQVKEKIELYDSLIKEIDKITKEVNPCNIRTEDGKLVCDGELKSPCCPSACEMLGSGGCKTRNIGCKIWFCNEAVSNLMLNEEYFKRWVELCGIVGKLHIKGKKYMSAERVISNIKDEDLNKLKYQKEVLSKLEL